MSEHRHGQDNEHGHEHEHEHEHEQHGHEHGHGHEHRHEHRHGHEHEHGNHAHSADSCCSTPASSTGSCCDSGSCHGEELAMFSDAPTLPSDLQAGEARTVFQVDGMDCGECARTVQRVVGKLDGVRDVDVNFSTTKMIVIHIAATAELGSIAKAVSQVGYQPTLLDTTLDEGKNASFAIGSPARNFRSTLTAISGLLLAVGLVFDYGNISSTTAILFYLFAMLSGGFYAARSGLYALKSVTLDMNFLMTVAAVGAAAIGQWSEGATVVFLFAVGNWLQASTMERTRRSIRDLMNLTPKEALVRRNDQELTLPLTDLRLDDIVIVRPGVRLPMDGVITDGSSHINQAAVTGESIPVFKRTGDTVYAGSLNEQGAFEFRVTKRVEDSTIQRMIHLVEAAQAQKAPSQQFVDRFATYYTPLVVLLAVMVAILPPLFQFGSFEEWLYRALVLLVIACPCALVISTPVSIVAAIGNAAKHGVLIKGGAILEQTGLLRALAFDKTGTLTEGKPRVVQIEPLGDLPPDQILAIAAALESRSEHPLARAIVTHSQTLDPTPLSTVQNFQAIPGKGAQGLVRGTLYRIGSPAWILENTQEATWSDLVTEHHAQGRTVVLLADEHHVHGLIAIADTLREESAQALTELRAAGIAHTVMLTGDHERVAQTIAERLQLDEVQAELLPEHKLERIQELKRRFGHVGMVGDGINDAPALAAADIGIAMGGAGTDVALETADIVLMSDDLHKLPFALDLSRRALGVIKQNVWFSIGVKVVFLALTLVGLSNLWMAVFADTGAALIVIANGMRLMKNSPD
ncbi:heavy metal translocating P-type ATPase [Tumebacillus permanentifrigoris]|uniref:Cd(2+)-exporting ATPase n=1 Tax=Tumebacillus permanentifrigoris TaxID=378543 RepID=A0A316D8V9_9BACL|nr:cation-translocating P-type ATPase [Tumebacillus permanentifrigoris]PWK07452.1 Cd2+/Zn2+-exporting ATPase [Tumebacillus permanentifrigoris]